jgi:hypothetical protein
MPESLVTLGRNETEFALELAFSWLSCPILSGGADASQTECHAQDYRGSTAEVRGAAQPREDRGGDRDVQGCGDELRAPGGAEGADLAVTAGAGAGFRVIGPTRFRPNGTTDRSRFSSLRGVLLRLARLQERNGDAGTDRSVFPGGGGQGLFRSWLPSLLRR